MTLDISDYYSGIWATAQPAEDWNSLVKIIIII